MLVLVYGRDAVSKNVFTNGSDAFAKGRKRQGMSHNKHNPRNDRESATNSGTRSATDAEIHCRGIGH